jgi:hypothetical protein
MDLFDLDAGRQRPNLELERIAEGQRGNPVGGYRYLHLVENAINKE